MIVLVSARTFAQETYARPDIPGELMIDLGLNYLTEISSDLTQRGWNSKSLGLYYTKRRPLSQKFVFNYGVGMGFEKLDFGTSQTIIQSGEELVIDDFPFDASGAPIQKNRLAISYVDVPLEMRFYPRGTASGEGLFLSVGGIGGLRLSSHIKWKYSEEGSDRVQKISGNFDLNRVRYGYQLRFGYRGTHLFFKHYLSNLFDNELDDTNPRLFSVGINFSGF